MYEWKCSCGWHFAWRNMPDRCPMCGALRVSVPAFKEKAEAEKDKLDVEKRERGGAE